MTNAEEFSERELPFDNSESEQIQQLDVFGVRVPLKPSAIDSGPTTWSEVWQRVHQGIMSIVTNSVLLIADILSSSRSLVRGLGSIPKAISDRISGAHNRIEKAESNAQLGRTSPDDEEAALRRIAEIIERMRQKGVDVQVETLDGRRIVISLLQSGEAFVLNEIQRSVIERLLDAPLMPKLPPGHSVD